ncbi:MAG: DUF1427 family protein, partial [Verrucomicrobiaceae bacterium]
LFGILVGEQIVPFAKTLWSKEPAAISWIQQSDVSSLFHAYPELEHLRIRGSNELSLGRIKHDKLKSLTIETGGLPVSVIREVFAAQLPALEHLELWLGTDNYGWDGSIEDLRPIFTGNLFPSLKYLGLRNSKVADAIATELVSSPVLTRIEVLDLSLGTLSDDGGAALAGSEAVKKLRKLDLHYNFLSAEMQAKLQALPIEVDVDRSDTDPNADDDDRYVAVSE